ncbi:glycosyltransferase, partial [Formosa sp. S-31]|uniref:glycosyltransferase n=1 Tax=Formosa sp. S-31 TaxID=2790949 RepID=UPI003EB8A41A
DVLFAKILGYKIIAIVHEYHIALPGNYFKKTNSYIFDKTFGYFSTATLPISKFLEDKNKHYNKPQLLLPILYDFSKDNKKGKRNESNNEYFLFCGHARYARLILIIVQGFKQLNFESYNIQLKLILHGTPEDIKRVELDIINLGINNRVTIESKLPFSVLNKRYNEALALLVPLDPKNLQDKARFSQKTAEYLSSKRPVITVSVGEITAYFKDKENALVCESLNSEQIAEKMNWILNNRTQADEIGQKGYITGKKHFDYRKKGEQLHCFLKTL